MSCCLPVRNTLAAEQATQICVLGAVRQPGIRGQEHPQDPGLTIRQAILLCGGPRINADLHRIRVGRIDSKESYEIDLWKPIPKNGSFARQVLSSGDVLLVPYADTSKTVSWTELRKPGYIAVFGSVASSGFVKVGPGETVRSLIAKSGGFRSDHLVEEVVIAHVSQNGILPVKSIHVNNEAAISAFPRSSRDPQRQVSVGDVVYVKGTQRYKGHGSIDVPYYRQDQNDW